MSCELDLKETTGSTGSTQYREYWSGPTNGRAAACRRRLAAAPRLEISERASGRVPERASEL